MMGSLYLGTTDIITAAEPVTKLLNELTGEYVKLSVFDRGNIVVIKKEEARYGFRFYHNVGTILPAYTSAMGKAFLSELSETELGNLYPEGSLKPLTRKTITSLTQLKKELEQIRITGVSYDFEGNTEGLVGIASVIKDAAGKAVSAICTGISTHGMDEKRLQRLSELIKLGARVISYRLGYQDSQNLIYDIGQIRVWWERSKSVSS
jgi:DNA-binding IclR family transcriptional regulator